MQGVPRILVGCSWESGGPRGRDRGAVGSAELHSSVSTKRLVRMLTCIFRLILCIPTGIHAIAGHAQDRPYSGVSVYLEIMKKKRE